MGAKEAGVIDDCSFFEEGSPAGGLQRPHERNFDSFLLSALRECGAYTVAVADFYGDWRRGGGVASWPGSEARQRVLHDK